MQLMLNYRVLTWYNLQKMGMLNPCICLLFSYISNYFLHICSEIGIQIQHSVPYTPQQNDVAERKNRSLKEMPTSMLESKKFTANLWAEAMNSAVYIQKRLPHSSMKWNTPFESYFGHNPNVSNLRVFGSTAWAPNSAR